MKSVIILFCLALTLLTNQAAHAFENLDFEQAVPVLIGDYETDRLQDPNDVLPHWTYDEWTPSGLADDGFEEAGFLTYNDFGHLGGVPGIIGVFGGSDATSSGVTPIAGEYSVLLDPRDTSVNLHQTGHVPSYARSFRFLGVVHDFGDPPIGLFEVSLAGVPLPMQELGPVEGLIAESPLFDGIGDTVYEFGANIPAALVDTEAELRLYAESQIYVLIDNINFSSVPVPEPSSFMLSFLVTGALASLRVRLLATQ